MTLSEQIAEMERELKQLREREGYLKATFVVNMLRSVPGADRAELDRMFGEGFTEEGLARAHAAYVGEAGIQAGWRELAKEAADALKVFTGHDSGPNLARRYGDKWWEPIEILVRRLKISSEVGVPTGSPPMRRTFVVNDERITQQEIVDVYGTSMPIEAVEVLQNAGGAREAREKLNELGYTSEEWDRQMREPYTASS